jgi:hypothetical protein
MARSSGSSGPSYSYREWPAAERAAQKAREQKERQALTTASRICPAAAMPSCPVAASTIT